MATTLYLACISLISRQVVFYLSRLDDQRIFDAHSAEAALVALLPACAHAAVRADAARRAEAANPSPNPNPNRNPDPKPAPNPSPAPNPAPDPNRDPSPNPNPNPNPNRAEAAAARHAAEDPCAGLQLPRRAAPAPPHAALCAFLPALVGAA